jgi:hypothetical protein
MGARAEEVSGQPALAPSAPPAPTRKPLPHKALELVMVRWRDAWFDFEHGATGWRDTYVVQTVGFLVRRAAGVISVAQELLPGRDGFRAVTHIPIGVVESIITLARAEGAGRRAGDRVFRSALQAPQPLDAPGVGSGVVPTVRRSAG